jgi:hypothetical protein
MIGILLSTYIEERENLNHKIKVILFNFEL